jgi:hypothetical protein
MSGFGSSHFLGVRAPELAYGKEPGIPPVIGGEAANDYWSGASKALGRGIDLLGLGDWGYYLVEARCI